jgi:hypothetical protein
VARVPARARAANVSERAVEEPAELTAHEDTPAPVEVVTGPSAPVADANGGCCPGDD